MNTETDLASMLLLVVVALLTAKKTKFGQMTLRATKALEYLKTSDEPIRRTVNQIIWCHKRIAENDLWELPHWVLDNDEKYEWVAILIVDGELPMLVYQKSALRGLESFLMRLEEQGATIKTENRAKKLTVDMGDDACEISFWRNPKGGKYAPFNVEVK